MRGGSKISSVSYEGERERNECPDWLERFAVEYEKQEQVTAVEVARRRNDPSLFDQIHSIMNGGTSGNRRFLSVEDVVKDYQRRTGLIDVQKKALAQQIINAAEEDESEAKVETEKKKSKPVLLDQNPAIDSYITNVVDTNYTVQIPAILHNIGTIFARDGVNESDLDDPELARYINNLLTEKRRSVKHNDDARLGRYIGVFNEDAGVIDNPFSGLMPTPRRW